MLENIFLPSSDLLFEEIQNSIHMICLFSIPFGNLVFIYFRVDLMWQYFKHSHFDCSIFRDNEIDDVLK